MADTDTLTDEDRALAAEYALSLLEPEEASTAARRMRDDANFAKEVVAWQRDLSALADALEPVQPSAAARRALMAQVFGPKPANALRWLRPPLWIGLITAALVAVAVFVYAPDRMQPTGPVYTAQLTPEQRSFVLTVTLQPETGLLNLVRSSTSAPPAGRVTELWAIAPDASPVSLGVLPLNDEWQLTLPDNLRAVAASLTLALSDEPLGGSPTGAPTGAVLAAAAVEQAL
ncbi:MULTISPECIES: anti-sigma factor [Roseobacteraceae]|uniref:Anti-sigma-K factor rskA n=1 Tax=Pseudosulfitobacter pseudonitzschiae TaxID=1402135 RepID=A0A221K228_9RHOB|nr:MULTISPECIES: anti-sigma factor [Roseobacteraceae]ASM73031.1 anti-sigma-K factor rskA [Pseudosulfitobacter pseudonitzschiae]